MAKKKRKKNVAVAPWQQPSPDRGTAITTSFIVLLVLVVLHASLFDPAALDPAAPKGLVLACGTILVAAVAVARGGRRFLLHPLDAIVGAALVIALIREQQTTPAGCGPLWPSFLLLAAAYVTVRCVCLDSANAQTAARASVHTVAIAVTVVAVTSLIVHFFVPLDWTDTVTIAGNSFDAPVNSLVGPFANRNYLASWLLLGLPPLVYLAARPRPARFSPAQLAALLALVLAVLPTVALTWCRSALLCAVVIVPATVLCARWAQATGLGLRQRKAAQRRRATWIRLIGLGLAILIPLLAIGFFSGGGVKLLASSTVRQRWRIARIASSELWRRPLAGWGPGGFERVYSAGRPADWRSQGYPVSSRYAHNLVLQLWGALGLAGPVLFLLLCWQLLLPLWRLVQGTDEEGHHSSLRLRAVLALAGLGFLFDNLFNVTLFVPSTAFLFVTVLAFLAAAAEQAPAEQAAEPQSARWHAVLGLAVLVVVLPLIGRSYEDWQLTRLMAEARRGPAVDRLDALVEASKKRPLWCRFSYDVAGRLAKARRFREAAELYDHVETLVPNYQEVRTNRATVERFLSQGPF